jgi:hypothetical protein
MFFKRIARSTFYKINALVVFTNLHKCSSNNHVKVRKKLFQDENEKSHILTGIILVNGQPRRPVLTPIHIKHFTTMSAPYIDRQVWFC